jgi:hypothetical protein
MTVTPPAPDRAPDDHGAEPVYVAPSDPDYSDAREHPDDTALTIAVTEAKAAVDAVKSNRTASRDDRAALRAGAKRAVLRLLDIPGGVETAVATLAGGAA